MTTNTLRAVPMKRVPVAPPFIEKDGGVTWGWTLSITERRADKDACIRTKHIDDEFYDAILEARNEKTNARRLTN